MPQFQEEKTKRRLELLRRKEEEESTELLSKKYRVPYADLSTLTIEIDAVKLIPENQAHSGELVVFQRTGKNLKIGAHNPQKDETQTILKRLGEEHYQYDLYLVSPVSGQNTALVVVVGERAEAEKYAEKLGLAGIGALALDRSIGPAGLKKVWSYLHAARPVEGLALLGLGDGGNLCLEAQPDLLPRPVGAVFYDLKPLAVITRVEMPLLVQLDAGQETGWLNYLQPTGEKALVSINTFDDFATNSQAAGWAWRDTLDWFNRAG